MSTTEVKNVLEMINKRLDGQQGFKFIIASDVEKTTLMRKEMESYKSEAWDKVSSYHFDGDTLDVKYQAFLQTKANDLLECNKETTV